MTDVVMEDAGTAGLREEEPRDRKAHEPLRRPLEDSGWKMKKKKTAALAEFREPLQSCLQVEGLTCAHHTV